MADDDKPDNVIPGPWSHPEFQPPFTDGCTGGEHTPGSNPDCIHRQVDVNRAEREAGGRTMIGGSVGQHLKGGPAVFKGVGRVHTSAGLLDVEVMVSAWGDQAEVAYRNPGDTSWGPPVRCERVD
jgi:hypothetical protein